MKTHTYNVRWLEEKEKGFGKYKWADGKIYKGQFKNDKQNGKEMII